MITFGKHLGWIVLNEERLERPQLFLCHSNLSRFGGSDNRDGPCRDVVRHRKVKVCPPVVVGNHFWFPNKRLREILPETRREQRVRTLFGRVRPIPDMQSRNANLRGFAERTAVNTPLQGTAADLIKIAMIRIDRRLREEKFQAEMTLQVHDELLFDVPEKEVEQVKQLVRHEMESVIELKVPIVVDCGAGPNWRDLQ